MSGHKHWPLEQMASSLHALKQSPQCIVSFARLKQSPPGHKSGVLEVGLQNGVGVEDSVLVTFDGISTMLLSDGGSLTGDLKSSTAVGVDVVAICDIIEVCRIDKSPSKELGDLGAHLPSLGFHPQPVGQHVL